MAHPAEVAALQSVLDLLEVPSCNCDRCKRLRAPAEDDSQSRTPLQDIDDLPIVAYQPNLSEPSKFGDLCERMKDILCDFKAAKAIARLTFLN